MNILIPMAGRGQRFVDGGYDQPKPLIDVNGKPMIVRVLENLGLDGQYIFVVLKDMLPIVEPTIRQEKPDAKFVTVDQVTEGAACTCLLAKEFINNDDHLVVANCDQIMNWNKDNFLTLINHIDLDGCILIFTSDSPKNSYAIINRHGYITRVAEKEVISNYATTGVYHWSKGRYMVESCEEMIAKNIRYNNEFYLCPSYNQMLDKGLIVRPMIIHSHYPIGTPEDLESYLCKCKE